MAWTFYSLTIVFLQLSLAHLLLWVSVFEFLVSKCLNRFGLFLPCLCRGIFGFKNSTLCWHKLLFDLPIASIQSNLKLILSRFPFDPFKMIHALLKGLEIPIPKILFEQLNLFNKIIDGGNTIKELEANTKKAAELASDKANQAVGHIIHAPEAILNEIDLKELGTNTKETVQLANEKANEAIGHIIHAPESILNGIGSKVNIFKH